jgi:pantetheine-phosphate adenylyltransferase
VSTSAVYPGSFDPVTLGHLDVMARAAALYDRLIVAVVGNPSKQPLLPASERVRLIEGELARLGLTERSEVVAFDGLLVDLCAELGATTVVKGLRSAADLDLELRMAQMNRRIGDVETVFLATSPEHSHLSSTLVREVARFGGRLDAAVTPTVADAIRAALAAR